MSKSKAVKGGEPRQTRSEAALWKSREDRHVERERKRMAVLATATEMFLERGSHRVSMNDIADQLGITKPALYNYFGSKDEMLFECFRQGNVVAVAMLGEIEASAGSGLDQLRQFIERYIRMIAEDYGSVMVRLEDRELPDDKRQEVRRFKRAIERRIRAIIEKGIADGSIVPCDVRLTSFAIFGALNWVGQWYRADGPSSLEQIGSEFVERISKGVQTER